MVSRWQWNDAKFCADIMNFHKQHHQLSHFRMQFQRHLKMSSKCLEKQIFCFHSKRKAFHFCLMDHQEVDKLQQNLSRIEKNWYYFCYKFGLQVEKCDSKYCCQLEARQACCFFKYDRTKNHLILEGNSVKPSVLRSVIPGLGRGTFNRNRL